ncbi:MAG: hypothetical protein GC181_15190 [Bacteroidetes bacterium]|nr:hypothetical protein [Bacteroidota bacterium]
MLFQLRNLSDRERELMLDAPALVGILIGSADGSLSEKEVKRLRDTVHTKAFSEKNDLHHLFKQLDETDFADRVTAIAAETAEKPTIAEKEEFLIERLKGLNKILPKLDSTYSKQYREALHSIAVSVANASGGVMGIGRLTHEEADLIKLPFIDKV